GLAPNGRPWDWGACGYATCQAFAEAAAVGRTTLKSCPPYLDKQATQAQLQAAEGARTGRRTFGTRRDRPASGLAGCARTREAVVLVAADRALYRAKAPGRNQVATGER